MQLNEKEFRNSAKNPFYPPGYGGKSLYPPLEFASLAADAITFYTPEERAFKSGHVYKDTKATPKKMDSFVEFLHEGVKDDEWNRILTQGTALEGQDVYSIAMQVFHRNAPSLFRSAGYSKYSSQFKELKDDFLTILWKYKAVQKYRGESSLASYFYRILYNFAADEFRKEKRHQRRTSAMSQILNPDIPDEEQLPPSKVDRPDVSAIAEEARQKIADYIKAQRFTKRREKYLKWVDLVIWKGYSPNAAARELGIPKGSQARLTGIYKQALQESGINPDELLVYSKTPLRRSPPPLE